MIVFVAVDIQGLYAIATGCELVTQFRQVVAHRGTHWFSGGRRLGYERRGLASAEYRLCCSRRIPPSRWAASVTTREACASRAAVSKVARAPYSSPSESAAAFDCSDWRCSHVASANRSIP